MPHRNDDVLPCLVDIGRWEGRTGYTALGSGLMVVAAVVADPSRPVARIGLLIVAAGFGTVAVVEVPLIHQRPLSVWLPVGLVPSGFGAYLCFAT